MKQWKRNAVIATVLLFICAGVYLNWSYNQKEKAPELTHWRKRQMKETLTVKENREICFS